MADFSPTKTIDNLSALLKKSGPKDTSRARVLLAIRRRRYTTADSAELPVFEFSLVTAENAQNLVRRAHQTTLPAVNPRHEVRSEYAFVSAVVVSAVPFSEFVPGSGYAPPFVMTAESATTDMRLSAIPIQLKENQQGGVSSHDALPGNPLARLAAIADTFVNSDAASAVLEALAALEQDIRAEMQKLHQRLHSHEILPTLYGLYEEAATTQNASMRDLCSLKQRPQEKEMARTRHVLTQLGKLNAGTFKQNFDITSYLGPSAEASYADAQGFYVPLETSVLHTFDDSRIGRADIESVRVVLRNKLSTGQDETFSILVPCYLCVVPEVVDARPNIIEFDLRGIDADTFPALGEGANRDSLMSITLSEIALRLGALLCGVVTVSTFWRSRSAGELPTAWTLCALRNKFGDKSLFVKLCDAWLSTFAGYTAYNILFHQNIYDPVNNAKLIHVHNAIKALVRRDNKNALVVSNPRSSISRVTRDQLHTVNQDKSFIFLNAVAQAYAAYYAQ